MVRCRHGSGVEANRTLRELQEEVKQLRAAAQLYGAIIERLMAVQPVKYAPEPAAKPQPVALPEAT
jgi:hypothetical protein